MGMWNRTMNEIEAKWNGLKPGETLKGYIYGIKDPAGYVEEIGWTDCPDGVLRYSIQVPFETMPMDEATYRVIHMPILDLKREIPDQD